MRKILSLVVLLLAALAPLPASAMQFAVMQGQGGLRFVVATGDIGAGDARKLASALNRASRDKHGTKELYLDSPGGVVGAAFQMADVMQQVGVTTIVPPRSICASACASVLFVAGKYRTVEPGGGLLIHSCFDARSGSKIDYCDAAIAARAQQQGISGGAMMAFQELAPGPSNGILFSASDAACFGLTLAPGKAALGNNAPCIQQIIKNGKKQRH